MGMANRYVSAQIKEVANGYLVSTSDYGDKYQSQEVFHKTFEEAKAHTVKFLQELR